MKTYLVVLICIAVALPSMLLRVFGIANSNEAMAILETAAQLGTIFVLIRDQMRRRMMPKPGLRLMVIALTAVMIADLIYGFTIDFPRREFLPAVYVEGILYVVYIGGIVGYILPRIAHILNDWFSAAVGTLTFVGFGIVILKYALVPLFARSPELPVFYLATCTVYAVMQTLLMGMIVPFALRSLALDDLILVMILSLQVMADIALHYQETVRTAPPSGLASLFEFGWAGSFLAMFAVVLKVGAMPRFRSGDIAGSRSARVLVSVSILAGLMLFFAIIVLAGVDALANALTVSQVLSVIAGVWFVANILAYGVSQRILSIAMDQFSPRLAPATDLSSTARLRYEPVQTTGALYELRRLAERYNDVAADANVMLLEREKNSVNEAIARTVQMLAHDVRRPFTKLRSGLAMLENVEDLVGMRQLVSRVIHQVSGDLASVNHMLADILVAGNEVALELGEIDACELLTAVLVDICALHPAKDVSLELGFESRRLVRADSSKLTRVAANIFDNALHAVPSGGRLWVRTSLVGAVGDERVEIRIGNSGSFILPEDLPRLFEPFFTKGKKNGTGLGLSIVQRLVEAHGGTITCTSSSECGTEFVFTIPAADCEAALLGAALPGSSAEARAAKGASAAENSAAFCRDSHFEAREETMLEESVRNASDTLGQPLRVLVLDDERLYHEAIQKKLLGGRRLVGAAEVRGAATAAAALAIVREWSPELVVCDVDLGDPTCNGFDVVLRMRAAGYRGKICVHSSRSDTRSFETALAAGADAFLPKPMSRIELLGLLMAAVGVAPAADSGAPAVSAEEPKRAKVAVIDDDVFVLEAWEMALAVDAEPVTFSSPTEFWKAVEKTPEFLGALSCVVTDYHFDNSTTDDGVSFAEAVRQRAVRVPILLSSNADLPRGAERAVHGVIDKVPMSWAKLAAATGLEAAAH